MKRLNHFDLSFRDAEGLPRMWTVLIGENGTAKSTILQAIALAAAGRLYINDLASLHVPSLMPRARGRGLEVRASFAFSDLGRSPWFHASKVELPRGTELISRVNLDAGSNALRGYDWYRAPTESEKERRETMEQTPLEWARGRNTAHWFVAGYGVNRHLPHEYGVPPNLFHRSVERLRPIFDQTAGLTGIDFIDLLGPRTNRGRNYLLALNRVLINTGLLPPDVEQITLKGRVAHHPEKLPFRNTFSQRMGSRSVEIPLSGIAHGMQSTLAWVSDLVGHVLYEAEENLPPEEMEGCVLIDEIDLYLHPTWQVSIVHALRITFPLMQFIVTAHSPAMLAACRPGEIVRLAVDPQVGTVERVAPHPDTGEWVSERSGGQVGLQPDPRTLSGSEIYDSYFGLAAGPINPEGAERREMLGLRGVPWRTPTQDARLAELEEEFRQRDQSEAPAPAVDGGQPEAT